MAGFLVPAASLAAVRTCLESIAAHFSHSGKLHITDLEPQAQQDLREAVFAYLARMAASVPCLVYEAIHQEGSHRQRSQIQKLIDRGKALIRSPVKVSIRPPKELVHVQLFEGIFSKAVAFALDQYGPENQLEILVVTDHVDDPIRKAFLEAATSFLNVGAKKEETVKGFDTETESTISKTISYGVTGLEPLKNISVRIEKDTSPLTLAADILANSLNHHFTKLRPDQERGCSLSTPDAVEGHPLANQFYGLWDDSFSNYAADALYMHPIELKRLGRRKLLRWSVITIGAAAFALLAWLFFSCR